MLREMRRVLRPGGGRLSILEVPVGAATDGFLNGFVDRHNSVGHEGRFVDDSFRADLAAAGFHIETDELCRYTWDFAGEDEMIEFINLMFWLDKATPEASETSWESM
jgi:SAM-dependent methyltransferase